MTTNITTKAAAAPPIIGQLTTKPPVGSSCSAGTEVRAGSGAGAGARSGAGVDSGAGFGAGVGAAAVAVVSPRQGPTAAPSAGFLSTRGIVKGVSSFSPTVDEDPTTRTE